MYKVQTTKTENIKTTSETRVAVQKLNEVKEAKPKPENLLEELMKNGNKAAEGDKRKKSHIFRFSRVRSGMSTARVIPPFLFFPFTPRLPLFFFPLSKLHQAGQTFH